MAGHWSPVSMDPALVKWQNMSTNRHKFFRWTPRTAWVTFAYGLLVPGLFYAVASSTEGKYEFRGKRRGDTIVEW